MAPRKKRYKFLYYLCRLKGVLSANECLGWVSFFTLMTGNDEAFGSMMHLCLAIGGCIMAPRRAADFMRMFVIIDLKDEDSMNQRRDALKRRGLGNFYLQTAGDKDGKNKKVGAATAAVAAAPPPAAACLPVALRCPRPTPPLPAPAYLPGAGCHGNKRI